MKDDTISRAAALSALADYIHNVDRVMGDGHLSADDCMDAARSVLGEDELPSAQPVEDARAMCGECDAWNKYKNYPQPEQFNPCTVCQEFDCSGCKFRRT